jgi:hypothetical protein
MAEKTMTRAEYEELIKQEKKEGKKSRPKKSVGAKKKITKKPVSCTGKPVKWSCAKGGAHYWKLPVASKTKTTKGKCKKCKKTRRFLNKGKPNIRSLSDQVAG